MPDINLFEEPGFQESPVPEETITESEPKQTRKLKTKKKRRVSVDEIIAAVVLIGIGSLVVWYLSLRWTVKSEVVEFTPEEFITRQETGTGI